MASVLLRGCLQTTPADSSTGARGSAQPTHSATERGSRFPPAESLLRPLQPRGPLADTLEGVSTAQPQENEGQI